MNSLGDFVDLINVMKQSAVDAVRATKPTAVVLGTVVGVEPLKINVEQRLTLTENQLILTRNVTDFEVEITVEHETEDASFNTSHNHDHTQGPTLPASFDSTHRHEYKGRKKFTVHNALKTGDEVLMIQEQGGQRYIVLDRVM